MKNLRLIALAPTAAIALAITAGLAARHAPPSIEGSYILDYRELPDGTKLRPPQVIGMITFTRDHRNFNVYWQDKGKTTSIGVVSKYSLTDKEYAEENIYGAMNDESSGKAPTYDTTATRGTSPVTVKGDKIEFNLPLRGEPAVVFDKSGMTATRAGAFVDHWKKLD